MNLNKLTERILAKGSFLCIGLDPDINKIPDSFHNFEDPIFEFVKWLLMQRVSIVLLISPIQHFLNHWDPVGGIV
jgi:orotidine-5'-phosphate decarboxylase